VRSSLRILPGVWVGFVSSYPHLYPMGAAKRRGGFPPESPGRAEQRGVLACRWGGSKGIRGCGPSQGERLRRAGGGFLAKMWSERRARPERSEASTHEAKAFRSTPSACTGQAERARDGERSRTRQSGAGDSRCLFF